LISARDTKLLQQPVLNFISPSVMLEKSIRAHRRDAARQRLQGEASWHQKAEVGMHISERRAIAVPIPDFDIDAFVIATLSEDLGGPPDAGGHDVTSEIVIPIDAVFTGVMGSRAAIVVAGLPIAAAFFQALDQNVKIDVLVAEGEVVSPGTELMRLTGNARALLTAERSALNVVQHLTGIATLTREYVRRMEGTGAVLLDTRKTIPGLRLLEKYATRTGGAKNYRLGLWDAVLIKDNHIAVRQSVGQAVGTARAAGVKEIIVEVDRIDQIESAIAAGATHLLLDNMEPALLRNAVALVGGRVVTEASGGVSLDNIRTIAETGVTYVSVGRITQSAPAADVGLDFAVS
jgi:nicotinate-nucleotide pyrophosphorylase (carboxylating)